MRLSLLSLSLATLLCACGADGGGAVIAEAEATATPDSSTRAPVLDTGSLQGAPYRIEIPAGWNGELVLFAHGYYPEGTDSRALNEANPRLQPLLEQGFAVAASAYSAQGWAVAEAQADTERLRRWFVQQHGTPRRTWLVGESMGGLVALASAEQQPGAYDGVLSMCGLNTSAEEFFQQAVLPGLVAFDVLYPGVLPAGTPGEAGMPTHVPAETFEQALRGDEARARLLARRYDTPRARLAESLMMRYAVLGDLNRRAGGFPLDNTGYVFAGFGDDDAFNRAARRYVGDPRAMAWLRAHGTLAGDLRLPVVLQSNHDDWIVTGDYGERYARQMRQAGGGAWLTELPRVGHDHCQFVPRDFERGLEVLRKAAVRTPAQAVAR